MRRTGATLAVVALVVLAGCSALTGPGPDAGGIDDATLPPGVSQTGVENASALADAHRDALVASGFEHALDRNTTIVTGNGSQHLAAARTARAGANLSEYRVIEKRDVPTRSGTIAGVQSELWGNKSVAVLKLTRGNRTAYRRVALDSPRFDVGTYATFSRTLAGYLRLGNYTVAGVDRSGTEPVVRLTAEGVAPSTNTTAADARNVSNYSGQARVTSTGVVRSLQATVTIDTSGTDATVRVDYGLRERGDETVTRPTWVPTALNRSENR